MTPGKPVRAASYCRLSLAIMGDTTKVDDQDRINHELATRRGWVIPPDQVYKDNSRSAWQRTRKRPGWDAMLAAVQRGEVDAIIVYHGDRLVRQPRDLEDLLDIASGKGVKLASPTGEYNLDDPDHQMMLRWMAARARNESDNTSRRMKAGHERRRQDGIVRAGGRGGRAFAFEMDNSTHVPAEVELVREGARRVLAAESIGSICRDWEKRGIVTTTGRPYEHGSLKKMLMRPRYAGLMPDGVSRASWEPVYDDDPDKARETWAAVCAVLAGKTLSFTPTNARKYLLSGVATCGPCGEPVQMRQQSHRRTFPLLGYGCVNKACKKKVQRQIVYVDEYVIGMVLKLLGDEEYLAGLSDPGSGEAAREIGVLEARKAEVEQQMKSLAKHPNLDPGLLVEALASFDREIEARRADLATSTRQRLLLRHAGIDRAGWDALPLDIRRALVRGTVRVTILPTSRRGPGFDPDSVDLDPVTE